MGGIILQRTLAQGPPAWECGLEGMAWKKLGWLHRFLCTVLGLSPEHPGSDDCLFVKSCFMKVLANLSFEAKPLHADAKNVTGEVLVIGGRSKGS